MECPYCQSQRTAFDIDEGQFVCLECERLFDNEDILRENLRHRLSPLLDGTSEEEPLRLEIVIGENGPESVGLSSLELPQIDSLFETQDGVIYYHIYGYNKIGTAEPIWNEVDDLSLDDLRMFVETIENEVLPF